MTNIVYIHTINKDVWYKLDRTTIKKLKKNYNKLKSWLNNNRFFSIIFPLILKTLEVNKTISPTAAMKNRGGFIANGLQNRLFISNT